MRVAAWIAGALAFGWLATAGVAVAFPRGHPPWAFYVGGAVVLVSFVLAPIGVGAAVADLRRARPQGTRMPRLAVAALALNALFLLVALGLWFWIQWEASRR